jgi:hypothetical protein
MVMDEGRGMQERNTERERCDDMDENRGMMAEQG